MATRRSQNNHSSGYDANFEPELDKKYQCPICLAAMRIPVQTKCGHRFCKSCLNSSCGSVRFAKCPVDNTRFDTINDVFTDIAVKREILSLTVTCSNKDDGCTWKGELRELESHAADCPEALIHCEKCGEQCRRHAMDQHTTQCPQRSEACHHCHLQITMADMAKHHLLACMKFPVNCVVCGETGILREDIPKHTDLSDGDCPLVTVKCGFRNIGCYHQDKRMKMESHYREANHQHMLLICNYLMRQEEQIKHTEHQMRETTDKCSRLWTLSRDQELLLGEQERVLTLQSDRIAQLERSNFTGSLLWKIKIPEDHCQPLISPPFYTGSPGYKVRVMFKLSGMTDGAVCYSTTTLVPEQGMFDEHLQFPCQGVCCITVFTGVDHNRERIHYATNIIGSHRFPGVEEPVPNQQHGQFKFLKTKDLLDMSQVFNGHLFLQLDVHHFLTSNYNV